MTTKPQTHGRGGKRTPGPGKQLGRPKKPAPERTVESVSITLSAPALATLDKRRGKKSRGKFIAEKLKL